MWFDSWSDVVRVVSIGAAAYATLVAMLRISGKRTLAKLNAFDLIVTVALGSTLATSDRADGRSAKPSEHLAMGISAK